MRIIKLLTPKQVIMKVDIKTLTENMDVSISGKEEWLNKIYKSFNETPKSAEKPLITGEITINVDNPTYVQISGKVSFSPFLSCSRCATPIRWPLAEQIDLILLRERPQFEEEADLEESELDEYYLDDGEDFDLEVVINDALQTARPVQTILRDEKGNAYLVARIYLEMSLRPQPPKKG